MHLLRLLWFLPLVAWPVRTHPDPYPRDYFRSPLGIPISLSGNFAEMRSNHFHTGLDIRTNGQSGYRVYAAADGWVARVAVSPGGYGNALYVDHPNGFQTVYAHLDRFEGPVADYVRSVQYAREAFSVDLYPEAGRFPVTKGEVIAFSGNSGSSGGPHLHFEIRESATAQPINPLLFGIPVDDETRPRIYRIKLYPRGPGSSVRVLGRGGRLLDQAVGTGSVTVSVESIGPGRYGLRPGTQLQAEGRVGFGIQTHDYHERSNSRLGAFRIRLDAGERTVFTSEMERLDFALNRYLNAHIDYGERQRNQRWIQRSYLLPGNRLPIYRTERSGIVDVAPGDTLPMRYTVQDVFDNQVELSFDVIGSEPREAPDPDTTLIPVSWNRSTTIEHPGILVRIPDGALYEDLALRYEVGETTDGALSRLHHVHDDDVPVHLWYSLSIKADSVSPALQDRVLIARRLSNGGLASQGGSWDDGFVTTRTRSFGDFFVAVDTTAPRVRPLNLSDGADLGRARSIRFRISDDLSGISSYRGLVDGEWVLFAYDSKNSLIEYTFDGRVPRGSHVLELSVVDGVGNETAYRARFTR